MATMTVEEAFDIQAELSELEFPYFFNTAPLFGFFKVCLFDHQPRPQSLGTNLSFRRPTASQPSRSSSSKTGQLSKPENASKRSADTGTIMSETTTRPNSERRVQALARMNYMHGLYRKGVTPCHLTRPRPRRDYQACLRHLLLGLAAFPGRCDITW